MTTAELFFVLVSAGVVLLLFRLLRAGKLREKYAALWALIGTAIVVLSVAPGLLESVSRVLGVQIPSNLLFFLAILLLLAVCLHLSLEISKLEDETRILAEEVAILRLQQESFARREDATDG
ncbi:MAG: DUF2304 domain-containing protein [Actinomycetales bacterium]|nr:DUF2304 domain-containing protein [Actinomycetales bacterium]